MTCYDQKETMPISRRFRTMEKRRPWPSFGMTRTAMIVRGIWRYDAHGPITALRYPQNREEKTVAIIGMTRKTVCNTEGTILHLRRDVDKKTGPLIGHDETLIEHDVDITRTLIGHDETWRQRCPFDVRRRRWPLQKNWDTSEETITSSKFGEKKRQQRLFALLRKRR